MNLTEEELNELRRINGEDYQVDGENEAPVLTVPHSISYAENALERRIKQNLETYHDL